ncbi:MAG: YggS family pyridoxal phosphate-dependent enzyme [Bacteroidales bacterium]|nr:YggS family pyridoxal phosphate-dependent enzyme [Bacteroidales bacterium]
MTISESIQQINASLPSSTKLIAVSKTHPAEAIEEAYAAGMRDFGENKVQELAAKAEILPKDIRWHMIGHLQTNKVKYIAPFVHLIHSVDSLHLLQTISKEAVKNNRTINYLLEVHIAQEESKFGLSPVQVVPLIQEIMDANLPNVRLCGLMCMATNTDDADEIRNEFRAVSTLFKYIKSSYFADDEHFAQLSMGMSHDYKIAAEEGSTYVRVGTAIFGARDYGTANQ